MSFDLLHMSDINAIHVKWNEDFNYRQEALKYEKQLSALLEEADQPQYILVDMTRSSMSFNDIMFGIQRASKGETSLFKHPKARQFIVISDNQAIQMSAAGLEKIGLRDLNIKVVGSLDEAKAYILQKAS